MSAFIIGGQPVDAGPLRVRTFRERGVVRFAPRPRTGRVTELVVHESVTRSAADTVAVLQKRKLSTHLIVDPYGRISQHGDLGTDLLFHAANHNDASVGVEVVNPYYPRLRKPGDPWSRFIQAPWADEGVYVLPTPAQAEALAQLVAFVTSTRSLNVPRRWIGLEGRRYRLGPVPGAATPSEGVLAHHAFGHADGAWLVLYSVLRLEARLTPERAYAVAVSLATGAKTHADLSRFLPAAPAA
jgi:hypothetical protein